MLGRDAVTVCFFGEGAMAEGEFHESMNLAALWRLPILFLCENNLYAMGTALARSESETNLALKAAAYEVPSWSVDGMDVLAVNDAAQRAVAQVRESGSPVFLEARTFRFRAHSMYDPDRYREKAEIETVAAPRPVAAARRAHARRGVADRRRRGSRSSSEIAAEIDDAVAFAEASAVEPVEDLTRFVHTGIADGGAS